MMTRLAWITEDINAVIRCAAREMSGNSCPNIKILTKNVRSFYYLRLKLYVLTIFSKLVAILTLFKVEIIQN